jgi:hypothetical protein
VSQDAEQSKAPAATLSLCAHHIRVWGSASYWSLIALAAAWLVALAGYETLSRVEPLFHRILSVVILGVAPAAIAVVAAYVIRASFFGLSSAFDPAERVIILFALGATRLCREGLTAIQTYWPVLVMRWRPRLQRAAKEGTTLFDEACIVSMRIGGLPIRLLARILLRMLAASQRVALQ